MRKRKKEEANPAPTALRLEQTTATTVHCPLTTDKLTTDKLTADQPTSRPADQLTS
jgi:hypothetical protein